MNEVSAGKMTTPANVNEVYTLANTRLVVKKSGVRNIGTTFATIEGGSRSERRPKPRQGDKKLAKVTNNKDKEVKKGTEEKKKASAKEESKEKERSDAKAKMAKGDIGDDKRV